MAIHNKKPTATLIDSIYRATFRNELTPGWQSQERLRNRLTAARRFVLDDSMSAFLADLASAAFINKPSAIAPKLCEQLRVSARLPHKLTWIEYNLRKELIRVNELHGESKILNPADAPLREGWLLEQHPQIETAFRIHLFNECDEPQDGFYIFTFPVCYAWTTTDDPLPWQWAVDPRVTEVAGQLRASSEVYTGISGYHTDRLAIVHSDLITNATKRNHDAIVDLVQEWTGVMRRVFALLATINDIPVVAADIRASKGFVAKGRYRKFLDHKTLTLNVPQRADTVKVARNLIAYARRRAHEVRGHWRLDWTHSGDKLHKHEWRVDKTCACGARRMWVHEHQRGDAALGFVTHSYNVKHVED